jgi:predicted SnoaL-like aldol condensation-catalyzing enzyme
MKEGRSRGSSGVRVTSFKFQVTSPPCYTIKGEFPDFKEVIMADIKKNKQIIESFINNAFVKHDLSGLDKIMRDDYIQHNPDAAQGKKGFIDFFEIIFKALPDFKYTIRKIVAEGDIVMAYCTTSGTHTGGSWLGKNATGNRLKFDAVDVFRIQDGMIAEHWDVADTFKLFSQLGIIDRLMAENYGAIKE